MTLIDVLWIINYNKDKACFNRDNFYQLLLFFTSEGLWIFIYIYIYSSPLPSIKLLLKNSRLSFKKKIFTVGEFFLLVLHTTALQNPIWAFNWIYTKILSTNSIRRKNLFQTAIPLYYYSNKIIQYFSFCRLFS